MLCSWVPWISWAGHLEDWRSDAEELLDRLAVEVAGVHAGEDIQNFRKPVKPRGFGRHGAVGVFTTCKGEIRHYTISGGVACGLDMNDKGPYHSY